MYELKRPSPTKLKIPPEAVAPQKDRWVQIILVLVFPAYKNMDGKREVIK